MSRMKKVLILVTNSAKYASGKLQTGLWLSELTHLYHTLHENGWHIVIASPQGGQVPIDPESLKPLVLDRISKKYYENTAFMKQLAASEALVDVLEETFDLVYLAGGHGTMYDFPEDQNLQNIIAKHYEGGRIVAAICHGVSGLLNVRLSNGAYLIAGKKITGFDWFEETLARRKKEVPFNLEAEIKKRKANFQKACIPMTSNVVVDGNLVTGQNPFSSKALAKVIYDELLKLP